MYCDLLYWMLFVGMTAFCEVQKPAARCRHPIFFFISLKKQARRAKKQFFFGASA